MKRHSQIASKLDQERSPSPTKERDINRLLNDQKDSPLQYPSSHLSPTTGHVRYGTQTSKTPTASSPLLARPASGTPIFSNASPKYQPGVPSSPLQYPQSYSFFEKPSDSVLWASRMELRDKSQFALQEFSTLAKEASSSQDVSEDILRVAKAFSQLEVNIKNTSNILTRMKASVADVHQSNEGILEALKTLPNISEGLAIDDLVKPIPSISAPNSGSKLPPY
ncbi:hypothetical protein DSO57_1019553 [Entomophthora muscae]|uniref:Uncharacterized protein n=1 Tax=Entomophthora muscae TaxID=34485 RepID=A0ACC2S5X1_9FUNG|nr:hypothetical protein DSO57_1019553 [Entomophthora muscae]